MISRSSSGRRFAAGFFMASGAGYVAAVKLTRGGSMPLATAWLAGVLPNLVCGAVVPLAAFLSRKSISVRDFLWMTLFSLIGLWTYELAQLWMPRRTFDWNDVLASFAGAILAWVLGAGFFVATRDESAGSAPEKALALEVRGMPRRPEV